MSEEQNEPIPQKKSSSGLVRTLISVGIAILVPAIMALLVYNFLLAGRLSPTDATAPAASDEPDLSTSVTVTLDEDRATVISDDPEAASPILVYQVALVCKNQLTADIVTQQMPHFKAMVSKLHRNRTESELNDPYMEESILRQVKQEANILLKKLAPGQDVGVIEALHLSFAVYPI